MKQPRRIAEVKTEIGWVRVPFGVSEIRSGQTFRLFEPDGITPVNLGTLLREVYEATAVGDAVIDADGNASVDVTIVSPQEQV